MIPSYFKTLLIDIINSSDLNRELKDTGHFHEIHCIYSECASLMLSK